MAKQKPVIKMLTYGIHSQWQSKSKELPQVKEFTTDIPAQIDIEFGFIVNIKKARGSKIRYCIDHPGILDDAGNLRAPFDGVVHVTNNDWSFYLGDTIWAPIADKCGQWRMTIELNDRIIADKTFHISQPEKHNEADFWKRVGY
ncbi:DUF3859 domain-containing protein [Psychromonas aquimarina]|uniref:DUF3859 domain-containing protein n=1 Tax=Psychromonas aquimarina TaxID=444919 RepID=UPI000428BA80|nr:DUF3859 domain-containing protein [Psychromonas aquimarina]